MYSLTCNSLITSLHSYHTYCILLASVAVSDRNLHHAEVWWNKPPNNQRASSLKSLKIKGYDEGATVLLSTAHVLYVIWVKWPFKEHTPLRLQVCVLSRRIRAQSSSSLSVSVAFWPIFLAVTGLAVNLGLVRCDRGAVQPFPAAHCAKTQTSRTFQPVVFGCV